MLSPYNTPQFSIKTEEIEVDIKEESTELCIQPELPSFIKLEFPDNELIDENETENCNIKKFSCQNCPYRTQWKGNLYKHKISRHTPLVDLQWCKCLHCAYQGKTRDALRIHVNRMHNKEIFLCPQCTFQSKTPVNIKNHIRRMHSEEYTRNAEKPYKCSLCSYDSNSNTNLSRHMLTHAKPDEIEWKYCKFCKFKTKYLASLVKHQQYRHEEEDKITWFKCTHCEYKAKRRQLLKRHTFCHHTEEGLKKKLAYQTKEIPVLIGNKLTFRRVMVDANLPQDFSFKCNLCPFSTAGKHQFTQHMFQVHAAFV